MPPYDYALVLRFENAGIFPKRWKDVDGTMTSRSKDDRIFIGKSRNNRVQSQWVEQQVNTIHATFIENVIRVLCGMRPISRYRPTCVNSYGNFVAIAKRSFVHIDNATKEDKEGNVVYLTEKMTIRKCMHNSWSYAIPSWIRFKYLLPDELYVELVVVASDICGGNAEEMLFEKVANTLLKSKDARVNKLVVKARESRCEPLAKLLEGNKDNGLYQAGYQGLGPYLRTLVTKGVCDVIRLDGRICIPVFTKELGLFGNGNGCATIFDGGLVRIDRVCDLQNTTLDMVVAGYHKAQQ
ncbi:hypothetical protein M0R72_01425 [Candidatus Pacearchaeota archaeon]|jgi:hypothetical protein|nr:hypothetical protein [Candidatus Pacearchaeota archaeon]